MKPLPIEIRPADEADRKLLIEYFLSYLQYLDKYGNDILPTRENAEWFVDHTFLPAAALGEPVLIAWHQDKPVGAIFWVIQQFPFKVRWKQAMGYGTYVDPDWRRQKIGKRLRQEGFKILKQKGVKKLFGIAQAGNESGIGASRHKGATHYGTMVRVDIDEMV
jgi:GNAT superfamily N-acetyltransferase